MEKKTLHSERDLADLNKESFIIPEQEPDSYPCVIVWHAVDGGSYPDAVFVEYVYPEDLR